MNYKISFQSFGIRLDYIITRHVRYSNLHCTQLCAVQKGCNLLTTKSLSLISMEAIRLPEMEIGNRIITVWWGSEYWTWKSHVIRFH